MDKKKTLLHVLMTWAKDKEPDLLLLDEDLVHTSEASQWSLTDLKQQVSINLLARESRLDVSGLMLSRTSPCSVVWVEVGACHLSSIYITQSVHQNITTF